MNQIHELFLKQEVFVYGQNSSFILPPLFLVLSVVVRLLPRVIVVCIVMLVMIMMTCIRGLLVLTSAISILLRMIILIIPTILMLASRLVSLSRVDLLSL